MSDLYAEALVTFRDLLDEARAAGDPEPTAMTVATCDASGRPSARTVLLKDGTAYVQAGAGVVADSTPQGEYEETINKAMGVIRAIERARTKIIIDRVIEPIE